MYFTDKTKGGGGLMCVRDLDTNAKQNTRGGGGREHVAQRQKG